ncbi:MAG: hypothetical protein ACXAEN_14795 [Candidatus Thorarchaeota archaeon]
MTEKVSTKSTGNQDPPAEVSTGAPCKRILIAGAARSGTKYMAKLLNECGIVTGHEKVFRETNFNGWGGYQVEVSCWVPHHIDVTAPLQMWKGTLLLHQVRNPMDTINSSACHWDHLLKDIFYEGYRKIYEQTDHIRYPELLKEPGHVEKAIAYYVLQNKAIEALKPWKRFQVEEVNVQFIAWLGTLLGNDVSATRIQKALEEVPKDTNPLPNYCSRGLFNFTLNELPEGSYKDELYILVGKYCYDRGPLAYYRG